MQSSVDIFSKWHLQHMLHFLVERSIVWYVLMCLSFTLWGSETNRSTLASGNTRCSVPRCSIRCHLLCVVHVICASLIHTHNSFYITCAKMSFVVIFLFVFRHLVGKWCLFLPLHLHECAHRPFVLLLRFLVAQLFSTFSCFQPLQQRCCDFFYSLFHTTRDEPVFVQIYILWTFWQRFQVLWR